MRFEKSLIQYGMASIPVKIGNAHRSANGGLLHMCCPECDSKVNQKNFCSNEECSNRDIIENARNTTNRYYEAKKGDESSWKILTKEELSSIKESGSVIEVLGRVNDYKQFSLRINKSWYCIPDDSKTRGKKFIKPWSSLRHALYHSGDGILVKVFSRDKEKLGIMIGTQTTLVIHGIVYEDEMNVFEASIPQELTEEDATMGETFVNSLKEVDPLTVKNEEREKLDKLLEGTLKVEPQPETDEMDFLKVAVKNE